MHIVIHFVSLHDIWAEPVVFVFHNSPQLKENYVYEDYLLAPLGARVYGGVSTDVRDVDPLWNMLFLTILCAPSLF